MAVQPEYTLSLMMKTSHSCFQKKIKRELGYELFKKTCHHMPLIKLRNMGPELNYPKSVTEYWNKSN
jgi:hypothetical protein